MRPNINSKYRNREKLVTNIGSVIDSIFDKSVKRESDLKPFEKVSLPLTT